MPSLPLHLANLSQLLQTRLQLYQPLLSLSGRLDLALAQIQIRQQAALQAEGADQGEHYVEGDSDDEEVAIETGDGDGEIEDVDMRNIASDEDEDEDSDDGDDEDEDEEDDDDILESGSDEGFLDLEAEEDGSEEEEDSEED
jgi:U3 small nucleolar RNA-associated protein 5